MALRSWWLIKPFRLPTTRSIDGGNPWALSFRQWVARRHCVGTTWHLYHGGFRRQFANIKPLRIDLACRFLGYDDMSENMSEKTIFKKIIDGEIKADIVYEDAWCLAFHDISAQAPIHVLVIPKKEVVNVAGLAEEDAELAGRLLLAIGKVARQLGVEETGYRVVANVGRDGGQSVNHLHFHLLAGRQLKWPPG